METVTDFIFLGSRITTDSDCRHEIKRRLLLGRNASVKVKAAQSCLTLCIPTDYTVPGILQARILEWVAFPFSRGSSQPRNRTQVSRITGGFFTSWATVQFSQFSRLVVSDSLRSHESQHARPPCPSPTLGVHSNLHPSHPLLSPFPPAPNPSQHQSFPMSQLFAWGGQSTGVSALASFLPKKSQGWSPSDFLKFKI